MNNKTLLTFFKCNFFLYKRLALVMIGMYFITKILNKYKETNRTNAFQVRFTILK